MDFKTEMQLRRELSDAWKLVDQYKRAEEYAAEWEKEQHAWKEAVINELVVLHIYNSAHDNDPRKAIQDAITYHCQIALDPQVSSDAQALVNKVRAEWEIEAKWQPIETAPKDQTEVILFDPTNNPTVFTGKFIYDWGASTEGRNCPEDDFYGDSPKKPTHWQPLPTPPQKRDAMRMAVLRAAGEN